MDVEYGSIRLNRISHPQNREQATPDRRALMDVYYDLAATEKYLLQKAQCKSKKTARSKINGEKFIMHVVQQQQQVVEVEEQWMRVGS